MFAYRQNKIDTSIGETWIEVAIICENQVKHWLKAAQNTTKNIINYLKQFTYKIISYVFTEIQCFLYDHEQ